MSLLATITGRDHPRGSYSAWLADGYRPMHGIARAISEEVSFAYISQFRGIARIKGMASLNVFRRQCGR